MYRFAKIILKMLLDIETDALLPITVDIDHVYICTCMKIKLCIQCMEYVNVMVVGRGSYV